MVCRIAIDGPLSELRRSVLHLQPKATVKRQIFLREGSQVFILLHTHLVLIAKSGLAYLMGLPLVQLAAPGFHPGLLLGLGVPAPIQVHVGCDTVHTHNNCEIDVTNAGRHPLLFLWRSNGSTSEHIGSVRSASDLVNPSGRKVVYLPRSQVQGTFFLPAAPTFIFCSWGRSARNVAQLWCCL